MKPDLCSERPMHHDDEEQRDPGRCRTFGSYCARCNFDHEVLKALGGHGQHKLPHVLGGRVVVKLADATARSAFSNNSDSQITLRANSLWCLRKFTQEKYFGIMTECMSYAS
eukprot:234309-Amphidinium_carterae.1